MSQQFEKKTSIKRVLIVGLGSIGQRYVRVLNKLYPQLEVAILRHKQCDKENGMFGSNHCFTNINNAINYHPCVAFICSPASMHMDTAIKLASEKIHLFVEKPISSTSDKVDDLIDLCRQQEIKLMTAYNLRFLPTLNVFRDLLTKGKVGKVFSVRAEVGQYLPSWRPDVDYRKTVSARQNLGGGVLLELSHEVDYLIWLFGSVKWVSANIVKRSNLEIDVDDIAHLTLGFVENELIVSLNMDFIRLDSTRKCTVIGEEGTLNWDGIQGKVQYYGKDNSCWEEVVCDAPDRDFTYECEINNIFHAIDNNVSPLVTGEDGLQVLRVIEAARQSSELKQIINIDE